MVFIKCNICGVQTGVSGWKKNSLFHSCRNQILVHYMTKSMWTTEHKPRCGPSQTAALRVETQFEMQ